MRLARADAPRCRLCGNNLTFSHATIGVCANCVMISSNNAPRRVRSPSYRFGQPNAPKPSVPYIE